MSGIRVGGGRRVCKGVFIPPVAVPLFFPSHFSWPTLHSRLR